MVFQGRPLNLENRLDILSYFGYRVVTKGKKSDGFARMHVKDFKIDECDLSLTDDAVRNMMYGFGDAQPNEIQSDTVDLVEVTASHQLALSDNFCKARSHKSEMT